VTLAIFALPGDLDAPTGGYAYARRLIACLPAEGVDVRPLILPASYPDPSPADLAATARLVAATPADAVLLVDGLALGAMSEGVVAGFGRPIVALVHHPLGLESGLPLERRAALIASEARALAHAARVLVTSPATARLVAADLGVEATRITVAEPGTEPAGRARGTGAPVRLLSVGAVSARKGYAGLVAALATLRDLDWRATIVGSTDRDAAAVNLLQGAIARAGLQERIALAGAVGEADLAAFYDAADIFVSPSLFEGYGMALAEALARGLPLVASTGGAAAETVPDAAALKVPPGDERALAAALRRAIADAGLRRRLADASFAAGQALPRWTRTAALVARVLREVRP
jgi:glycosyltransferase involved in cell wall biosynthesis